MRLYQETMNFWRQTTHMMSYFNEESFRGAKRLPSSFIDGFLQVSLYIQLSCLLVMTMFRCVGSSQYSCLILGSQLRRAITKGISCQPFR